MVLSLGQEIYSFGKGIPPSHYQSVAIESDKEKEGLKGSHAQALDSIVVTECSGDNFESGAYRVQQVELDVQAYQLRIQFEPDSSQQTQQLEEPTDNGEDGTKARVLALPSKELDGLWESYVLTQTRCDHG